MINEVGKIYTRPWGTYQILALKEFYQVKTIIVNPGGRLSLQKHYKRSEHWVVIEGNPTITVGAIVKTYQVNSHLFIPVGTAHRLENLTDTPIIIAETQIGSYLGEDDKVCLDDAYGRD